MSAHTRASLGKFFYGETILLECLVGNHLSPRIRTILPSPIRQIAPMRIHSLAFKMLCHAYDPLVLTSLSITEQFGKNFASKTLWKRDLGLWMRRHSCFPNIARLKFSISLKPKPPWFFGRQSLFQATQWIFLECPLYPHQNLWIIASMSLHRLLGILKQPIVNVGMACRTALIRTSQPAWDKSFSFHPCILCQILSHRKLKLCFFAHPTKEGSPKYFSYWAIAATPSISFILSLALWSVFVLKKSCIFPWLICWLEAC